VSTLSDKHGADKGGPDKDLPDEQQLDEYLRGGSDVSRQYRQLHSADIPVDLDRRVLREAQEAVKAQPAKSRKWMRWAGPLALAASTVLVVSIVIESGVHEETYLTAPASAPAEVAMKQEAAERPAVGNAADEPALEQDKAAGAANDASAVPVLPVMPVDSPVYDVVPEPVAPKVPAPSRQRTFAISQPAPAPAPPPASQIQGAQPPEEVEVRAPKLRRQEMNSSSTPVSVTSSEDMNAGIDEVAVTGARRRIEPKQTAGPRNTIAAPATRDSRDDADEEQVDEPSNYSDPEQWLREIRQLRKDNKHELADREWRRFRYVFPDYQVAENDLARGGAR
jgi:hypothetical protein